MALSARKIARIRQATAGPLAHVQLKAVEHVNSLYAPDSPEGGVTWAEASVRTRVSLALVQASLAAERAQTMSQAPRELGVVVVHARLEDTPQNRLSWESQAQKLNEARAIEAVVVPPKETNGS
jgi:hypothetical protein